MHRSSQSPEFPELYRRFSLVIYFMCCCLVTKSCLTLLQPHGVFVNLPGSSVHGISQARLLEQVAIFLQGFNPGIKPVSLVSLASIGGFFTDWATWEAGLFYTKYQSCKYVNPNLSIHSTLPCSPWFPYVLLYISKTHNQFVCVCVCVCVYADVFLMLKHHQHASVFTYKLRIWWSLLGRVNRPSRPFPSHAL